MSRSNTGQKEALSAPLIDWCTVVLDSASAKQFCRAKAPGALVQALFDAGPAIAAGTLQDRPYNYYPRSARLLDATGACAGVLAVRADGAVQVALTGNGCQHVVGWKRVADRLDDIGAHVSRVDIAVDDLSGKVIDVRTFKGLQLDGAFITRGRPPTARYVDDMGSGDGCTLYIGQRGHKQLCVYEKGKQLGDPESGHTRCELRLYGKRLNLPTDVLREPGAYFGAAYPPLRALVSGELQQLQVKAAVVNAHASGMVRALRRQSGRALGLLDAALGDKAGAFLAAEVLRPGRPQRFRGVPGNLPELVRQQLRHKEVCAYEVSGDADPQ